MITKKDLLDLSLVCRDLYEASMIGYWDNTDSPYHLDKTRRLLKELRMVVNRVENKDDDGIINIYRSDAHDAVA